MKKYNVFCLWVVEKDGYSFICERILYNEFKEVLTKEKLVLEENDNIKCLTRCYSILEVATYKDGQILNPLMLTKKDILLKYIELNQNVIDKRINLDDFLKKQQEESEGLKVLAKECPELAKQLARQSLQGAGILDNEGNLVGPYKKMFVKEKDMDVMVDMYETCINEAKENIPDIPIISAKELHKQKTLDKK